MISFESEEDLQPVPPDTMTPMIDVILSLIAFMMLLINAPLMTMDFDLPKVEQNYVASGENKFVSLYILNEGNLWRLNQTDIEGRDALEVALQTAVVDQKEKITTVLSIDKQAAVQRMIDTLDVLKTMGIKDTQIAIESETQ